MDKRIVRLTEKDLQRIVKSAINANLKNHIIDENDAIKLFSLEEDNLGPTDEYTDDDFNNFLSDYVGKTLWYYSKHRFPEHPKEQFELAIGVLGL
jgi:hypothetical protein